MIRYALYLISLLALLLPAYGESRTLWTIGSFDHSYREFAPGLQSHVLYRIGKSNPAKDWPDTQDVGSSYNIQFPLTEPPRGTFLLKIGVQVSLPGIPALQLQVNGHEGTFYLHPKLSNDIDDAWAAFDPHNSVDLLQIPIPASYLRIGENQIVISYVNQPLPNQEAARHSAVPAAPSPNLPANPFNPAAGYSSLRYDAISLENDPLHPYRSREVQTSVTPTIFYLEENGHLTELIDADLRFADAGPESTAKFTLNGQQYSVQIPSRKSFGEERVQIDVPAWTGPSNVRIDLSSPHKWFRFPLTPAKKWTVFVVPHTHIDVGYTDFQGKVAEDQARSLDDTLKLIHDNPDFRFSPDGSWAVEQFLNTRSGDQQDQFLSLIRAGKIGFPAQYATLLTGYASLETLVRSLFYSKALSRQYGLPFNYANTTDVPTYTGAYPSILASSGIKYWVVGGDNGRGSILTTNPLNEQSPFWWEGPDGKRVLFFYSKCYEQVLFLFGLPPQQIGVYESLPIFLQAYSSPGYKPDIALIYGTQPENMTLFPETATFATEWNKHFAYPRLQYATFPDFFHKIDSQYGDSFPVYKGDMGSFWEDGVASDAVATAQSRQNESGALTAEIASTVTHEINPNEHLPKTELEDAWKNIVLYAEHTWAAGESATRPDSEETTRQLAVKNNRATQAAFQIQDVSDRSMAQLADKIHIPAGTLVVFNPLSWKRDETVETDLTVDDQIIDISTNTPVPYQVLSRKEGFLHARFVARDLPSVGYKCFAIRSVAGSTPADPTLSLPRVVENDYYRVTLNASTGSIESIFDKQLSRELVDTGSPYHFGEYLYVTGGGDATQIVWPYLGLPSSQLDVHPAVHGTYLGTERTPFGYSIHLRNSNLNTPNVDTEILLYSNRKQIEFRYDIQKQPTTEREAAYVAFPVAASDPQFAYSSQMGWIDPANDMLKGANVGWFSVHKWMAVHSKDFSVGIVPMDAPLATFGDINRGTWPTDFHPASSTLFSYIVNNYWLTNTPVRQGGHFQFRYTMTSSLTFSPESLTRLGVSSMEPALLDHVVSQDKVDNPSEPLPAESASFLTIDNPAVMLVTWKMAEDGKGTVLRLQEIAGHRQDATVQFTAPISIRSAAACSAVEDPLKTIPTDGSSLHLTLEPHEVKTVCLMP